ncbi:DUF3108 domain-containing protein [bacterium]|nr:MAG: DUF3108 domain-containing protein [bacterium]
MKFRISTIILTLLLAVIASAKVEKDSVKSALALHALDSVEIPRPVNTEAFAPGELLKFSIDYGFVNAGWANMEVTSIVEYKGRLAYHIQTTAGTNKTFSLFFKVEDRVESLLDTEKFYSLRHEKHLSEGNYRADRWFNFDQQNRRAISKGYDIETYPNVMDVLSAFYYVRTLEFEPGDTFYLPNHTDGKNYPLRVAVHRREKVSVPAGTFECIVVEPILKAPGIFEHKGNVFIWLTDDEKKMPVLMKTKIIIGSIDASLIEYKIPR